MGLDGLRLSWFNDNGGEWSRILEIRVGWMIVKDGEICRRMVKDGKGWRRMEKNREGWRRM